MISKHDLECVCVHLTSRCSAPARDQCFPMDLCYIALCLTRNSFVVSGIICGYVSELLFDWICIGSNCEGVLADALESGRGVDVPLAVFCCYCALVWPVRYREGLKIAQCLVQLCVVRVELRLLSCESLA